MPIEYVEGDATQPVGAGAKVIVHVCNDVGGWGKGFVVALSRRWKNPERRFRAWYRGQGEDTRPFALGEAQLVEVEPALWVANVIGQRGLKPKDGVPPVRYDAIRQGLAQVAAFAAEHGASVHMPRIGCGLAGGSWEVVSGLIEETLGAAGVPVVVYDYAG